VRSLKALLFMYNTDSFSIGFRLHVDDESLQSTDPTVDVDAAPKRHRQGEFFMNSGYSR